MLTGGRQFTGWHGALRGLEERGGCGELVRGGSPRSHGETCCGRDALLRVRRPSHCSAEWRV